MLIQIPKPPLTWILNRSKEYENRPTRAPRATFFEATKLNGPRGSLQDRSKLSFFVKILGIYERYDCGSLSIN